MVKIRTSDRIRFLAPSERHFASEGVYSGFCVQVRGELDIDALSTAFAALRRRYPVLAAALEPDGDEYVIVARRDPLPDVVVGVGDLDAGIADIRVDQTRALSALHVVQDGTRAGVTLFTHHSIADGSHSLAVLADLWSLYTDVVTGRPVDSTVWCYPESMEKVLADRGIREVHSGIPGESAPMSENESEGAVSQHLQSVRAPHSYSPATARCRLGTDASAALLALARRHETTLNGVLSAVIMRVEAELTGVPPGRIIYTYPVDLRGRIEPPVAGPAATNPLGVANFVPGGSLADTVAVAVEITTRLRNGLDDKSIHQTGLRSFGDRAAMIAQLGRIPATARPSPVVSTNWGVVPPLRSPAQLEFEDFRALTAELRVDPDIPAAPPGTYVLCTFQDRLAIELFSPDDPVAAQKRIAAIEADLITLA